MCRENNERKGEAERDVLDGWLGKSAVLLSLVGSFQPDLTSDIAHPSSDVIRCWSTPSL